MRWWRLWLENKRLQEENDELRVAIIRQANTINGLRRVLAFYGFDVNIED